MTDRSIDVWLRHRTYVAARMIGDVHTCGHISDFVLAPFLAVHSLQGPLHCLALMLCSWHWANLPSGTLHPALGLF